jgi:hypothetical protein
MNTKVVDLATSNNFFKSYIGFFCPDQKLFECQQGFANSVFWLAMDFSSFSPQN